MPNIWGLGRIRDTKFGLNVYNKMLLKAAKYQISDLVTCDYMLLTMLYMVYNYVFVGGAVVFDLIGGLSEWQRLFSNVHQQTFQ